MNAIAIYLQSVPSVGVRIALILLLAYALAWGTRRALKKIASAASTPEWMKMLCDTFYTPSGWIIWGYGILLTFETAAGGTYFAMDLEWVSRARNIFFVTAASWVLLRWKGEFAAVLRKRAGGKSHELAIIQAAGKLSTILIALVAGMIILDLLEVQLTALVAFGGVGGVAVGFAAKDIVANFFGGVIIHLTQPFSVGEWILSPNKHFEGIVEEIGWYMTKIRTFARRPTFIPNQVFLDAIIENPGRMYNRRIKQSIGIRYRDAAKIEPIVTEIRELLKSHPEIDQDKLLFVHFVGFGPYSLEIEVYCFTKTTQWGAWREIQQGIFLHIVEIIARHGAELALPTNTVHLNKQDTVHPYACAEGAGGVL